MKSMLARVVAALLFLASSAAAQTGLGGFGGGGTAIGSIAGLGTGVATALGVNVGSAGAFVTFNGALGTPSSGVATNLTGTASGLTAGNVTTNANLTGVITSVGNATSIASQTGTGTKFVVDTSPTLVTPVLGVATGTSVALGGCTIGSNVFCVTGTTSHAGTITLTSGGINGPNGFTIASNNTALNLASSTLTITVGGANIFASANATLGTASVPFTGLYVNSAFNASTTPGLFGGANTPEGAVTANPGSLYMRNNGGAGTSFYVKESGTGNTGWVAK